MKVKCRPNSHQRRKFKQRWEAFYGFLCAYCIKDCKDNLTIDHVTPLCKGGGNSLSNLVIACLECNRLKGNLSVNEFKPLILQPIGEVNEPYKNCSVVNNVRSHFVM